VTEDEYYRLVGGRIKKARVEAGLSQDDLALTLGLGRVSISHMETGQHLKLSTIFRIMCLFRLRPSEVFHVEADELPDATGGANEVLLLKRRVRALEKHIGV